MIFKSDSSSGELNGFLDKGSRIEGDLHFDNSFRIDGKLQGKAISDGTLIVGEQGEVDGEVLVGTVLVSGVVRGTVRVARRVQLAPTAKVYADLHTPSLVIEEGATFEGTCTMTREAAARDAGPQLVQRVSAGGERPA